MNETTSCLLILLADPKFNPMRDFCHFFSEVFLISLSWLGHGATANFLGPDTAVGSPWLGSYWPQQVLGRYKHQATMNLKCFNCLVSIAVNFQMARDQQMHWSYRFSPCGHNNCICPCITHAPTDSVLHIYPYIHVCICVYTDTILCIYTCTHTYKHLHI